MQHLTFLHHVQNFNRYSYVLNNPLSLTDPSGYSWWTDNGRPAFKGIVAAIAAYYIGYWNWGPIGGAPGGGIFGGAQGGGLMAGVNGAAAGFAAGGIQGGNIQSAAYGALTGSLGGYLTAGTYFGNPLEQASSIMNDIASGAVDNLMQRGLYLAYQQGMAYAESKLLSSLKINPQLFDAALMLGSIVGNEVLQTNGRDDHGNQQDRPTGAPSGSRYVINDVLGKATEGRTILGFMNRGLAGIPFDTVDFLLEVRGMPSATVRDWIQSGSFGQTVSGHSLGGVTVAYLVGNGLASSGYAFAPGLGKAQPPGVRTCLSSGDAVNLSVIGTLFNPSAQMRNFGPLTHAFASYHAGCK